MVEAEDADRFVVCETFDDLASAQIAQGLLADAGIDSWLKDQNLVQVDWRLAGALGGIRLQVRRAELENARTILGTSQPANLELPGPEIDPEESHDAGHSHDALAHRAYKAAITSTLLMLLVPFALSLAIKAIRGGDLSIQGRKEAHRALLISSVWGAFGLFLFYLIVTGL